MRTPTIPPGARIIRTYSQYDGVVAGFLAGHVSLLLLIGRPGLSKSESFSQRRSPTMHLINGWLTPLQAFIECFKHRNKLLIFDDAETLWSVAGGRVLMRSLCESKVIKTLRYGSTTRELQRAGVPQEFSTSSSVAIIANSFSFGQASECAAILDRAHVIYFDPPPAEVHRHTATWFWNQSIFDCIGERLHRLRAHSGRLYVKAWELMQAGGDWRGYIEESLDDDSPTQCVQRLEFDPECPTVGEKVAKFTAETGMSRATFFNLRKRLKTDAQLVAPDPGEFAGLKVQGQPPVRPNIEEEVARAQREDAPAPEDFSSPDGFEGPNTSADDDQFAETARHNMEPPDNDPKGWARRQLAEALRRGDMRRVEKMRALLRRMEEGESGDQAPFP